MALAQPVLNHAPPPDTPDSDHDKHHTYSSYPRLHSSSHGSPAPSSDQVFSSLSSPSDTRTASSPLTASPTPSPTASSSSAPTQNTIQTHKSSYVFVNGILDVRPPSPPGQKSLQAPYPPAAPPKNGYRSTFRPPKNAAQDALINGQSLNGTERDPGQQQPEQLSPQTTTSNTNGNLVHRSASNASTTTTTASVSAMSEHFTPDNNHITPLRSQSVDSYVSLTPTASTSAASASHPLSSSSRENSIENNIDDNDSINNILINGLGPSQTRGATSTLETMSNSSFLSSSSSVGTLNTTATTTAATLASTATAPPTVGVLSSSVNTNHTYTTATVFSASSSSASSPHASLSPPLPPLKQRRSASTHGAPFRRSPTATSSSSTFTSAVVGRKPTRLNSYDFSYSLPEKSSLLSRDFAMPSSSSPSPSKLFQQGAPSSATTDEDAAFQDSIAKQAEQIRKEREAKRRNRERREAAMDPTQDTVLVGNLVGEDHVNYVLMYNMLTGIRVGVSRCQAKASKPVTDEDYVARHKFTFDIVGNELTPSARYDFKFKDYAPWVFRALREYFHLDPADYLLSLTAKYILSELGSPGKSGSFFYFSRDYRFIIKTIHHAEHKFLRSILKEYHEHVMKNPHTLLSRFYGLHRVKLPRGRKIHFLIMNNLFPPHRDIHETYDLKGSSVGREYPEEKAALNPRAVLKDLNWIHRHKALEFGPEKKALFEEQLRRDTEFLQRMGIIDYSLLTGIHDIKRGNKDNIRDGLLTMFQPDAPRPKRRPAQVKRNREDNADAIALRKAVQRSDPKALDDRNRLPDKDTSERRHFIFYQDEGGFQATDDANEPMDTIYYFGVIDILTKWGMRKRAENFFKGFKYDRNRISPVKPEAYGQRFLNFLYSVVRGGDKSKRPKME